MVRRPWLGELEEGPGFWVRTVLNKVGKEKE
jgi:hypothetical protein